MLAVGIPVKFELIPHRPASAEDFGVLGLKTGGQIRRKDFRDGFAEQIAPLLQTNAAEQGPIDRGIAAGAVLDEKGDLG